MLATTSSRGFTSAHNSTITSNSSKQKQLKTNTANLQNSVQGAKSHKKKIKAGANKNKSNDKIEKPKEKAQSVEKSSPPELHGVRSFNTAETEMTPSVHSPKKYVLFVGNLPYSVTKEQVEDHFRKTGKVVLQLMFLLICPCFNPIALRRAKTQMSFGPSECNRVNVGTVPVYKTMTGHCLGVYCILLAHTFLSW